VGVICLTPENLTPPWLLFEAGALSKLLKDAYVCTYLIGVEPTTITGPLAEFQHTLATRDDTQQMVRMINGAIDEQGRLPDDTLDRAFNHWWPELERRLKKLPALEDAAPPHRKVEDMLQEVLEIVRDLAKLAPPGSGRVGRFIRESADTPLSVEEALASTQWIFPGISPSGFQKAFAKEMARQLNEVVSKPETPNTLKPVTPQKRDGRRRRQ